MKICKLCNVEKEFDEFYKRNSNSAGRIAICKSCSKTKNKEYYQDDNHKLAIRETETAIRLSKRKFLLKFYQENPCIDCGEKDPVVLELDHVRGNKIMAVGAMATHGGVSLEKLKEEIAKCEVRCANCHRRKTAKDQNWYADLIDSVL